MNARLGPQPPKGIFALNVHGGRFNTRDFTLGQFGDYGFEALVFSPAQIHAQDHVGPILSLGSAGTGLNFQIGIILVLLATEHAAEFELCQMLIQCIALSLHGIDRILIVFLNRHF